MFAATKIATLTSGGKPRIGKNYKTVTVIFTRKNELKKGILTVPHHEVHISVLQSTKSITKIYLLILNNIIMIKLHDL